MSTVARSIVANRIHQFAALYDPDSADRPQDGTSSRVPGKKGYFRESTGSFHIALSNRSYDEYRQKRLERHPFCHYCGRPVTKKTSNLDHVLPQSRGGGDWPANLVLACKDCNGDKQADTPAEWLQRIEHQLERLQAVRENLEAMLTEGELSDYSPAVPQGRSVHPTKVQTINACQQEAKGKGHEDLHIEMFALGKRRFDIVSNTASAERLIRNLSGTDMAHYLKAVGLDVLDELRLRCSQNWHLKRQESELSETE